MRQLSRSAVLATVGYSCLLSLSALSFWSPLSLVPSAVSTEAPSFYPVEHFGLALGFLIVVLGHYGDVKRVSKVLFGATFVLMVIGYVLSANSLGGAFDLPSTMLLVGALCTGLGSGFGLMCWMQVFERFAMSTAMKIMAGGSVFAAVPTLAITYLQTINPMSFSSFVIILLLISLVLLVMALQQDANVTSGLDPSVNSLGSLAVNDKLRLIIRSSALTMPCIVVLSLFQPLLDASGLSEGLSSLQKTLLSQCGNCAGALAVLMIGRTSEWRFDITRIFLLIVPVFATICLLFPFVDESYWFIFSFVSMGLFSLLSLSVMYFCLQFACQQEVPLLLVYSALGFCLYAPGLLGMALAHVAMLVFGSSKLAMSTMLLFIAAICATLAVLIVRHRKTHEPTESTKSSAISQQDEDNPAIQFRIIDERQERGASCVSLASHFDLTAREEEILEMLAHGRNVPFIAETLSLSSHTVRCYVKSIYSRMNVYSRQELIDLVEQWPSV